MAAIGMAESSGRPEAVNPGNPPGREYSVGLWQINMKAHGTRYGTEAQLKDPLTNARGALAIYRMQGLRAWGAYTDGRYRRYLAASQAAAGGGSAGGGLPATLPAPSNSGIYIAGAFLLLVALRARRG
jgi:hypothetical protein